MNLTLTQSFHRTQTLSGELKAAESALTDCEADANAKERIASIAAEAVEKAKAHLEDLRLEREQLANHMAALVRKTGEPLELAPLAENGPEDRVECAETWSGRPGYNSIFTEGADFQAQALENGAARITDAFDRATQ